MSTFFAKAENKFLPPDGTIVQTVPFLKASGEVLAFIDMLGTAFKPVKSDISGNINKLRKKYDSNPEKFTTLHEMIDEEIASNTTRAKEAATVALLWLGRALKFIHDILKLMLAEPGNSLTPCAQQAYADNLKPYHGWMTQKIFSVVSRATPYKSDLMKTLAYNQEGMDEQVKKDTQAFLLELEPNLEAIKQLYVEKDVNFQDKV